MSLRDIRARKQERLSKIIDEIEGVGTAAEAESRELNEDDQKILAELQAESQQIEESIKTLNASIDATDRAQAARLPAVPEEIAHVDNSTALTVSGTSSEVQRALLPATARYSKSKYFDNTVEAYACGQWVLALCGNQNSQAWCKNNGIIFRNDMGIGTPGGGGNAVPAPLAATMIRLVEEYGVYRRYARQAVMSSNTMDVPKITGHTTVYYPAEGTDITTSDLTIGQVNLVAKKYASQTKLSTELQEDAVVSMVDQIAQDFAWNFARAEDTNSFLGDGTAPFGGITGIETALLASSTITSASIGSIALADLEQMVGKLPQYAGIMPRWFMHSWTYHTVVVPALTALGGTDMRQTEEGGDFMLLGYPVTFTQVLPGSAQTTGDMPVVLGDLNLGAYSGQRRQFNFRQLNELYASTDQIGVIATMRADSVIHETGTATASDPAGALIKLIIQ